LRLVTIGNREKKKEKPNPAQANRHLRREVNFLKSLSLCGKKEKKGEARPNGAGERGKGDASPPLSSTIMAEKRERKCAVTGKVVPSTKEEV